MAVNIGRYGCGCKKFNQHMCIVFTVDNVDAEYDKLKKLGVNIIEPPITRPWGARNMHFCDPYGNHIYFRSFPV